LNVLSEARLILGGSRSGRHGRSLERQHAPSSWSLHAPPSCEPQNAVAPLVLTVHIEWLIFSKVSPGV
jgi:hypothetical protein